MTVEIDLLRALPYFATLAPEHLESLNHIALQRSYAPSEIIFLEGHVCEGLCIVHRGRVKIFKAGPAGKEHVLRVMRRGDWFNAAPVFDDGPNPASAQAIEVTDLYIVPKAELLQLARRNPEVALAVVRVLAENLRYLTGLVEDLAFLQVTERVAKVLLQESVAAPGSPRRLSITQQELAFRVGTAREVVGRVVRLFAGLGAVRLGRGVIEVVDPALLDEHVSPS